MAIVQVTGVFMGCHIKTSNFDGKEKNSLRIDLYQPDSEANDKMVTVSTDQLKLLETLNKDYSQGSLLTCTAYTNAYRNQTYYKLDKIVS